MRICEPRPTPTPAACEHPDSRIVWEPWSVCPSCDRCEPNRLVTEQCAVCEATLAATTLWESEVER
jgi:hypothetical protein